MIGRPRWLLAPLLAVIGIAYILPLLLTLSTAVQDPDLQATLPRTAALLRQWDGDGLPPAPVFPLLGDELVQAVRSQSIGALARRLNFEQPGLRAALLHAARAGPLSQERLVALDPIWAQPGTWRRLRRAASGWTALYVLRALDLAQDDDGRIAAVPPDQAVYRDVFVRTFGIAALATALTLLIGYPVAASLASLAGAWGRAGLALVLMPLWISILVRTAAWFILLQREGPLNAALMAIGVIEQPAQLLFTRFAVVLAIVHVMLPYAILPLFAAMRRIDAALLQAAAGLGARPWQVAVRVHLPLAMPGVLAGGAIVFLLSVGFWVTPALIGGPTDQLVGSFVAADVNETLNWGMAAALGTLLLAGTAACLAAAILPLRRRAA
jgi:putative spermidine/putrescine transport system permease protein